MPPRSLPFAPTSRDFICRSCRAALHKQAPSRPGPSIPARHSSSQAPQPRDETQSPARQNGGQVTVASQAERQRTLRALGLDTELSKGRDRNKVKPKKTNPGATINFFEQGKGGKIRRVDGRKGFEDSVNAPRDKMVADMGALEKRMELAENLVRQLEDLGADDSEHGRALDPSQLKLAPHEDRTQAEAALIIPSEPFKRRDVVYIDKLNHAMIVAERQLSRSNKVELETLSVLWRQYSSARKLYTRDANLGCIPQPAWDLLWRVFAEERDDNPNRMSRLVILSKDMLRNDVVFTDAQHLLSTEALYIDGWKDEALQHHKRLAGTLGAKPDTFMDYWTLGLRMNCLQGDFVRAERIMDIISESSHSKDPRFRLPYIRACAARPGSAETAYKAFRGLRSDLGSSITIEDYDSVISNFLSANQTEYALYVFVDMMTQGAVDLSKGAKLSSTIGNTFFFGKWLKRLIGGGDLKGAYNVLLLMQQKAITPRPIHVNGLIGAWIRSDSGANIQLAETVAWAMINARVQFVQNRRSAANTQSVVSIRPTSGWPRATLETFSLLAESYTKRGLHSKFNEFWKAFQDAEMAPDAFLINQLLFSLLHAGEGKSVLKVFREVSAAHRVQPDSRTFFALWSAVSPNRLYTIDQNDLEPHISEVRAMFGQTVRAVQVFNKDKMDDFLGPKIIHSFRKVRDWAGMLLAMRAMKHVFGYVPMESVVFEVLTNTMDLEKLAKNPRARRKLTQQVQRVDHFLGAKRKALVQGGELAEADELPEERKREEIASFLEFELESYCADRQLYPGGFDEAVQRAAVEMSLAPRSGGGGA